MPATELMGWNKDQQRWFKRLPQQHGGKLVAVGCPTLEKAYPELMKGRTQEASRQAANQWWRDKLDALAAGGPDERPFAEAWQDRLRNARKRHAYCIEKKNPQAEFQARVIVHCETTLAERGDLPEPPKQPRVVEGFEPRVELWEENDSDEVWSERFNETTKPSLSHSIEALIDKFGKFAKSNAAALGLSYDRACNIKGEIARFGAWVTNDDIRTVKGMTLVDFRQSLLDRIDAGTLADSTARDTMSTTKRFVRWCFETAEVIDSPPRNINSRDLNITVSPKAISLFSDVEVKTLLTAASERQRLYYLLILNTGMTSCEIALLDNLDDAHRHDADYYHVPRIDWKKGTITRKRTKTKKHANVPTVTHKLWAETLRLLKKHGHAKGSPVLTNEDGGPLAAKTGKDDKKQKRNDCIGLQFRRLRQSMNENKTKGEAKLDKDLRDLRKTASSQLDENNDFARYAEFFLGHSPKGTAGKHYVVPSQAQFDAAVTWLESVAISKWGVKK